MTRYWFPICLVILLGGCIDSKKNNIRHPEYLIDYLHLDGSGTPQLWAADSLRHFGQYEQAAQQYAQILIGASDNKNLHIYLLNQLVQLNELMGQWEESKQWQDKLRVEFGDTPLLDNDHAMGDYWYNRAEAASRNNQIYASKKYYFKALIHHEAAYGANSIHYKLAQTYTALGQWFAEFNPDSSYVFISKATDIYEKWDTKLDLSRYKIRYEQTRSKLIYFERDYYQAVAAHDSIIQLAQKYLPMNSEFVAQCYFAAVEFIYKDSELLKKAEFHLQEGKKWLDKNQTDKGMQLYYNAAGSLLSNKVANATDPQQILGYELQLNDLCTEIEHYFADGTKRPRYVFLPILKANYYAYCRVENKMAIQYYHQAEKQFLNDTLCCLLHREMIQHGLTTMYSRIGDFDNAMKYAKRYILFGSKIENRENIGWDSLLQPQILGNKHYLYVHYRLAGEIFLKKHLKSHDERDLQFAYKIYCTIDTLIDRSIFSNSEEAIIQIIQREGEAIYGNAIKCAYLLHQKYKQNEIYASRAFAFMEKQKAYILRTKTRRGARKAPPGYLELVEKIQARYQEELRLSKSTQSWSNSLLNELKYEYPEYNLSNDDINTNSLETVQQELPKKTAFVEYFSGHKHLYAFVVTKDTIVFDTVCSTEQLQIAIDATRKFYNPDTMAKYQNNGIREKFAQANPILSKALLGRIYTHLRNADSLIIIRDKQINDVVFETLFEPDQPVSGNLSYSKMPFLVWRHNIVHSPSYWWHKQVKTHELKRPIRVQAFANDEFKGLMDSLHNCLPNSRHSISKHVVNKRNDFLDPLLKSNDRDMTCIYSHGTGANSEGKCSLIFDSSLQIYGNELQDKGIRLDGNLVLLIACEGAKGSGNNSEDIHTLTWYLQYAGAGTIISSNYNIPPEYGGEVLHAFLRHLDSGMPPDCALSAAKRQYLRKNEGKNFTAPYFWASLFCSQ